MEARPVDPRIIGGETHASYHVYFWADGRRRCEEFELLGAGSVHEALAWADSNAHGREIEIAVVVGDRAAYLVGPLDHSSPV